MPQTPNHTIGGLTISTRRNGDVRGRVELTIDFDALARTLGVKAANNKSLKTSLAHGMIRARFVLE